MRVLPVHIFTCCSAFLGCCAPPALAQPLTYAEVASEFDWATIGALGNAAYDGPEENFMGTYFVGRGSVDYEYQIAKTEINTGQWIEFANALAPLVGTDHPAAQYARVDPLSWGATRDVLSGDNTYLLVPEFGGASAPVLGIEWVAAAVYSNWLHNGKSIEGDSLLTGAYDVASFSETINGFFDPRNFEPLPGARFRLPTRDEWMKAGFYDPNRFGEGEGGWWTHANMKTEASQPGFPSEPGPWDGAIGIPPELLQGGETSAQLIQFGFNTLVAALMIPPGSYPDSVSPWGLLDVSGGASEHLSLTAEDVETILTSSNLHRIVTTVGTSIFVTPADGDFDALWFIAPESGAAVGSDAGGIRLVTIVPAPATTGVVVVVGGAIGACSRRRGKMRA
ncbi:MAG: SUMF1/EgtB/PvdO family nonheme iron enzyme [Planctomycetota bacterium]